MYSCDPLENYADPDPNGWAQSSYQSGDWNGLPAPNAFSDPWAKDQTSDTEARMTAFLGASSWGDACIFTNESDTPSDSVLAQKAFEMLYGDGVSAAYQLKARGATSPSDPDVVVNRWFRLDATMLQRVQTLRAGIPTVTPSPPTSPDLYARIDGVCEAECAQGSVEVSYSVGNQGYAMVHTPFTVDFWDTATDGSRTLIGTQTWRGAVPAGELLGSLVVRLEWMTLPITHLSATIDGGDDSAEGVIAECDEHNHTAEWDGAICE